MGLSILIEGVTTAYSVGMGCGTCCGSGMGIFMSGYLATHSKNFRQSLKAFFVFYIGKILAVTLLCLLTALIGTSVISGSGYFFGIAVELLVDIVMICAGVYLLTNWVRQHYTSRKKRESAVEHNCQGACNDCSHCSSTMESLEEKIEKNISIPLMLTSGICYGITPCAPLILMLGYCVTLPVIYAAAVGMVFAIASALSPTIIVMLLSGGLAAKFRNEIEGFIKWFQLACYIYLIAAFAVNLLNC